MIKRKITHYPLVDMLFLLSMLMAIFMVLSNIGIEGNIKQAESEIKEYSFENELYLSANLQFTDGSEKSFKEVLELKNYNFEYDDLTLVVNKLSTSCLVSVFVSGDIEKWYPLVEGRYPTEAELENSLPVAMIGKDRLDAAYEQDGKEYINIENERYEVVGIFGSKLSNFRSYDILLFDRCLGKNVNKKVNDYSSNMQINCHLGSDSKTANEMYSDIWNILNDCCSDFMTSMREQPKANYETNKRMDEIPALLGSLFCIVEILLLSEIWFYVRIPELVIRKSFGYSNNRLMLVLLFDYLKLLVVFLITAAAMLAIFIRTGLININLSFYTIAFFSAAVLCTGSIALVIPLYFVCKKDEWLMLKVMRE